MYMNAIPKKMIVSYKYPSFRPINLLQKFPYYVKGSVERKNTEFLGWARSRIFLNAISLKSYFNSKISGSQNQRRYSRVVKKRYAQLRIIKTLEESLPVNKLLTEKKKKKVMLWKIFSQQFCDFFSKKKKKQNSSDEKIKNPKNLRVIQAFRWFAEIKCRELQSFKEKIHAVINVAKNTCWAISLLK